MERTRKFPLDSSCEFQVPGRDRPIGVFDSGVGGLHLLNALSRCFPNENFIYYADTAYLPYGIRTREEIADRVEKAFTYFEQQTVKLVVVPCHTASLCGAGKQELLSCPAVYISDCLLDELKESSTGTLLLLATKAALDHGQYAYRVRNQLEPASRVHALSCPELVELAENPASSAAIFDVISKYLAPLREPFTHCLLGCTHYIYFKRQLEEYFHGKVSCCDGVEQCCAKVGSLLTAMGIHASLPASADIPGYAHHNIPASLVATLDAMENGCPSTATRGSNQPFQDNSNNDRTDRISFVVTGNNALQFVSRARELITGHLTNFCHK